MRNDDARPAAPTSLLALLVGVGLVACGGEGARPGGRAGDSASAVPDTRGGELAYVTNEGSGELTILDTSTDSVVGTIPVGTRPRGIRLSQDGRTVFVALSGSPRCPPTMPDEECEALKSDKTKDGIGVIDVMSRKVTKVLPGGSDPEAFDISKDGTRLFVSNEDSDSATIVDIESGEILSTVPVGREPEGVELHPSGKTVWVTGETAREKSNAI
jgi:YVTN family beta-propeller protein